MVVFTIVSYHIILFIYIFYLWWLLNYFWGESSHIHLSQVKNEDVFLQSDSVSVDVTEPGDMTCCLHTPAFSQLCEHVCTVKTFVKKNIFLPLCIQIYIQDKNTHAHANMNIFLLKVETKYCIYYKQVVKQ